MMNYLSPEEIQSARQEYGLDKQVQPPKIGYNYSSDPLMKRLYDVANTKKEEKPGGLLGSLSQDWQSTKTGVQEAVSMAPTDPLHNPTQSIGAGGHMASAIFGNLVNKPFQQIGEATGVNKVLSDAAKLAVGTVGKQAFPLWSVLPDTWKEGLTHAVGATAKNAGSDAMGKYSDWAKNNPNAHETLKGIADTLQALTLIEGAASLKKPIADFSKQSISDASDYLSENVSKLKQKVSPSISPELDAVGEKLGIDTNKPDIKKALKITQSSEGQQRKLTSTGLQDTKKTGVLRRTSPVPTQEDVRIANSTRDIFKGIGETDYTAQGKAVEKALTKSESIVRPTLENQTVEQTSKEIVNNAIKDNALSLKKVLRNPDLAPHLEKVKENLRLAIQDKFEEAAAAGRKPNAYDVLLARREWIRDVKSSFPKAFDLFQRDTNAKQAIDALYSSISKHLEGYGGKEFKDSMTHMSNLIKAGQRINTTESASLGTNVLDRNPMIKPVVRAVTGGITAGKIIR